jgi:hypothetical protein
MAPFNVRVPGGDIWTWIWVGLLALGTLGFVPSLTWGRRTHWRNLDEVLRGAGTITVSVGMLLLLHLRWSVLATILLFISLALFTGAFLAGKRLDDHRGDH